MVRLIDLIRGAGSRLRKFGQKLINGVRTGAQKVGNVARNAYNFTRTRIIPGVINGYHGVRRLLGRVNRVVEASSDAAGQAADTIRGETGNKIRQGKERFDQKYQQGKDRLSQIHDQVRNRAGEVIRRGSHLVNIGYNTYNRIRSELA